MHIQSRLLISSCGRDDNGAYRATHRAADSAEWVGLFAHPPDQSRGAHRVRGAVAYNGQCRRARLARSATDQHIERGETVSHQEDRELVPLQADFDTVFYGFRRSQVKFYMQQTENEMRMLTEDRDSALGQVADLSTQLEQARAEIESMQRQLDEQARNPIDESALSDRLRRMVRLAHDEAAEVVSSARAAAEHEWARSEQSAAELRARYERLVADADEWRQQSERQRTELIQRTREDVQRMSAEAEQHRRKLDTEAEERRTQVEYDFEVSMAARREEAMRVQAEREQASRAQAQRRVREATAEAQRRVRRAEEYAETMLRLRRDLGEQVRAAQRVLDGAEPFLAATETGTTDGYTEQYVDETTVSGRVPGGELRVPRQRDAETGERSETDHPEVPDADVSDAAEGDAEEGAGEAVGEVSSAAGARG